MTVTTLTRTPARHWRLLNWLRDCAIVDRPCRVATAVNEQGATGQDLIDLEDRGLIAVYLGDIQISFAEQFGAGRAPITAMLATTMRLTRAGVDLVLDDPNNLVIRTLYRRHSMRFARQIRHVRHEAQVDDDTLKEMDTAGLIQAVGTEVRLSVFRRLPGDLQIRLTHKGRRYAAAP